MLDLKLDLLRYYILLTDRFTKQKIGSLDDLEGLFSNKSSKLFKFFPYFPDALSFLNCIKHFVSHVQHLNL